MKNLKLPIDIPPYFKEALELVQQVDPSALIAGGALRDTVCGREVKDVDIFVGPEWSLEKQKEVSPEGWCWFGQVNLREYHEGSGIMQGLTGLYVGFFHEDPPVWDGVLRPEIQIIQMDTAPHPSEYARTLDFGFNQIGYAPINGANRMVYTEAFWRDVHNDTATLQLDARDPNFERSVKRAKRLSQKYPDFQFMKQTPSGAEILEF